MAGLCHRIHHVRPPRKLRNTSPHMLDPTSKAKVMPSVVLKKPESTRYSTGARRATETPLSPQSDPSRLEEEHRGQIDDGFGVTLVANDAAIQCFTALGIRLFFLTGEQPTTTGNGLERRIDKVDDEIYPPCICTAIVLAIDRHSYVLQHLDPRNGCTRTKPILGQTPFCLRQICCQTLLTHHTRSKLGGDKV